jgi:hypothetical protein
MKLQLFIRVLKAIGWAADGLANLVTALSLAAWLHSAALEAMTKWFRATPEEQQRIEEQLPPLNAEEQALLARFQQLMDTQFEISALRLEMLTLPALPDEGY